MNFRENETEQKLRGGYYTPADLASFISQWTVSNSASSVLEPSCGDGAFIEAVGSLPTTSEINVSAFELFEEEAAKARMRRPSNASHTVDVRTGDFLDWAISAITKGSQLFDAVVGNPPFIRYQYLPEAYQLRAERVSKLLGLHFTKHTNAWVPFILASMALLRPGGRLGMIVPAEIIHITHAQSLRTYLGNVCSRILLINPEEIWFEGTLQGAVILLAEKKPSLGSSNQGVGIVEVSGRSFLGRDPHRLFDRTPRMNGKTVEGKWTKALLTESERTLLDTILSNKNVYKFSDIADVDVGIVTGANKFFLVPNTIVRKFRLEAFAFPMFGRSDHCPGVIYDDLQHAENQLKGLPTNFLWIRGDIENLPKAVRAYLDLGRKENLQNRYKCRVRSPWYTVPSVYSTPIGMLKRCHNAPRLIYNQLNAFTTDTAYRIKSDFPAKKLVYCFLNSLTALSAELEGRHYGGGVLELVPSEIERLIVPMPKSIRSALKKLDSEVKTEKTTNLLRRQDDRILKQLPLGSAQIDDLHSAWWRLRNRRHRTNGLEH